FTGFLAAVDPEFKSKVGEGKDVQWPTGTGAKGNAGVAGSVQQTTGAAGYVEQAHAQPHNCTYAAVKTQAAKLVTQSLGASGAGLAAWQRRRAAWMPGIPPGLRSARSQTWRLLRFPAAAARPSSGRRWRACPTAR